MYVIRIFIILHRRRRNGHVIIRIMIVFLHAVLVIVAHPSHDKLSIKAALEDTRVSQQRNQLLKNPTLPGKHLWSQSSQGQGSGRSIRRPTTTELPHDEGRKTSDNLIACWKRERASLLCLLVGAYICIRLRARSQHMTGLEDSCFVLGTSSFYE